jgi:hypothetical protein
MADQNDCSCADRQRRGSICKHMKACRLWMAAYKTGAVAPKPRPATPAVIDDAGIGDDLVILTPEGSAYLADQPADAQPARPSYESLYPACAAGCGDLVDRTGEACYRCLSEATRRQNLAAKRAMLANV